MSIISLGPFFNPSETAELNVDGLQRTGYCVEFSGEEFGAVLPLFRKVEPGKPYAVSFEDYFVGVDQLPFGIPHRAYCQRQVESGVILAV